MRAALLLLVACTSVGIEAPPEAEQASLQAAQVRGLLASPGLDQQAMKGVYFFAGDRGGNYGLYTAHALDERHYKWNSDANARTFAFDQLQATHANVVVMSHWNIQPQFSPMVIDAYSLLDVLQEVRGRPMVIMPAIESGLEWDFHLEFPARLDNFIQRIEEIYALFSEDKDLWAQMYDRNGQARHAIHILHACSASKTDDARFAAAFDAVANEIEARHGIRIGFTLDIIPDKFTATPEKTGKYFERTAAVLAIQGYISEVFAGITEAGDNNRTHLDELLQWKLDTLQRWVATGVPVLADTSSGFDGRIVWGKKAGYWGDNFDYTFDAWRNGMSLLKGRGAVGMTFCTWNGYTEGYAAVPSVEHGDTIYRWLTDLYSTDPRECRHVHYPSGIVVYGDICTAYENAFGERGCLGDPVSEEHDNDEHDGRLMLFERGRITWDRATRQTFTQCN